MSNVAVAASQSLAALNEQPADRFVEAVGPLFERSPRFIGRLAAARPFASWEQLFDRALGIALGMPEPEQLELIDSHPRLGADRAAMRARSELSWHEQGYDREGPTHRPTRSAIRSSGSAEAERVGAELARLNAAYEARFGFRFVVFVAGRSRAELLPLLSDALEAERDAEIRRALRDVVAIARDRRRKLGWS